MKVWCRGAALAGAALLWAGAHVGAQIRETVGLPPAPRQRSGVVERPNHPVVLLNTREGEFSGGERIVTQFMLKRIRWPAPHLRERSKTLSCARWAARDCGNR